MHIRPPSVLAARDEVGLPMVCACCRAPLTTVQQRGKVGWASQFSSCALLLLLPCCSGFRLVAWPPTLLGFSFQLCSCSQEIFLGNTSMRSPGLISLSLHAQLRPAGPQPGP